ncbi:MAG: hypothetical protein HKN32_01095 [Flavobacteriales bacterium]|nr:hypothetical protein [Flavobacteriales bacterium]
MDRTKVIYLSVIGSLLIHVGVLGVLNFVRVGGDDEVATTTKKNGIELDFVKLEDPTPAESMEGMTAEEIKSLVADANSETTTEEISYQSQEQIAQDVYDELKALEQEFFDELSDKPKEEAEYQGEIPEQQDQENYEYFGKSYEGSVSATFELTDRFPIEQPLPTYKCKTGGTVTVNISVGQQGEVAQADVNPSRTTTSNECLLNEALAYARKWKFDPSFSHPKKQAGTIIFKFQAQ